MTKMLKFDTGIIKVLVKAKVNKKNFGFAHKLRIIKVYSLKPEKNQYELGAR